MTGSAFVNILFLALTAGSVNATDWMTMVQPVDYFKSRNIEPGIDRMIDFIIEDVNSPKTQMRQLAAFQHLANESANFKAAKNYETNRIAIEEVAAGKRGKDPAGFGQEYAKRLLAKLDSAKPAVTKSRPLRKDALSWFPTDTKIALAFDMHELQDLANDARKGILTKLSDFSRQSLYGQLEAMGNIRVDRLAFGIVDAEKQGDQKMFLRISGQANHAWIVDSLTANAGGEIQSVKTKDADGTPITTLYAGNAGASIVLVGNTDLVIVSYQRYEAKHEDLVAELLEIRAKKKPHAGEGALKDRLAKIPDNAIAFLVGDLSGGIKEEIGQWLDPAPAKISAYAQRAPMGLDLRVEAAMKDAGEGGKLVGKVAALRKKGIAGLEEAQKNLPEPGMPLMPYQSLIKLVDTVQVQNQGATVEIRGFMLSRLIQEVGELYAAYNTPQTIEAPKNGK